MKKKLLVFIMGVLLLTGCETAKKELQKDISSTIELDETGAKLVCTTDYDYSELDYVIGSKYVVYADEDGNVTKVVSREIIESNDQSKLDEFQEYLTENHNAAMAYDGYTPNVTRSSNRVTSDVTVEYDKFDLTKFVQENESAGKDITEMTLDKIEAQYISLGADCKRK